MSGDADRLYRLIGMTQAAYARCLDNDDLEAWPDFFTDPCLYLVTNAENYREGLPAGLMYADTKGMLKDRISALRDANIYEQQTYRHILSMPLLRDWRGDEVASETGFMVARIMRTGETTLFATGRYIDRYRIEGETARLAERLVVCDSPQIDTLLAIPL